MPPPDEPLDVRDLTSAPEVADPGFQYGTGGLQPMSAADADRVPTVRLPPPDRSTDVRDLDPAPGTPAGPGAATGGLQPMSASSEAGQSAPIGAAERTADVRDRDPAPGAAVDPGFHYNGIQTMAGGSGGGSGGVQSNGFSGVNDPAALNRAGENAKELASLVHSKGDVGDDLEITAAAGSLSGDLWGGDLGVALLKSMETWDKQARRLTLICADIGEKCTTTAQNQTRTESANEAEMNSVRATLSDFG
ncbi:hypothetical protein [Streptomyces cavernicola]|uniref:Uncharacterized protein n=1 Tax=Streptomyces cavernicola TaxID=3043613 RepID=A0ABT6SE81_9ACTN|nr:hypothetical protein [Streptomyces sp. B-S-A6]MDI3406465.1 hypothetical protein [Streptomyces sp. B-S-A6]